MKYLLLSGLVGLFMFVFAGVAAASDGHNGNCWQNRCDNRNNHCCQVKNNNWNRCDNRCDMNKNRNNCCNWDMNRYTNWNRTDWNNWNWRNQKWNNCNWNWNSCSQNNWGWNNQNSWVRYSDWNNRSWNGWGNWNSCHERAPCGFASAYSWY